MPNKPPKLPFNPHPRKAFVAKGSNIQRCEACLMTPEKCLCEFALSQQSKVAVNQSSPVHICLLMHKEEAYKPTNTGRLIEHVLPENSHRFYWHRTEPDSEFIALIKREDIQPFIIFPGDRGGYEERVVTHAEDILTADKQPLFIILDGSWRQAGRMFRLSQYLQDLPVLPLNTTRHSQYKLRKAPDDFHLCTVEVAIELLDQHGQKNAAEVLEEYFQEFNSRYASMRREKVPPKTS